MLQLSAYPLLGGVPRSGGVGCPIYSILSSTFAQPIHAQLHPVALTHKLGRHYAAGHDDHALRQALTLGGQRARQPGQGIERMAHHIPAVTFSNDLAINAHGAVEGRHVERLPVGQRRTQDNAAVPGIVREQRQDVVGDLGVVRVAIINQLKRRP